MRLLLLALVPLAISGCKQRCDGFLDCGEGSYCDMKAHRCSIDCFNDEDCRMPIECRANPDNCAPDGLYCSQHGQCVGNVSMEPPEEPVVPGFEKPTEGWTDPVGQGRTYILDDIQIGGEGVGFDLDQQGGIDNSIFGVRDEFNPKLRQGLGGGQVLLLVEVAGIDDPYTGDDDSVTLKIYGGIDADYPMDHLNDFGLPAGREGRCCEFKIDSRWLTVEDDRVQATVRAPAYIKDFRLYAPTNFPHYSFDVQFLLTVNQPPYKTVTIAHSQMQFDLDSDLGGIRRGVLGGGITANSLATIDNPFCGSSMTLCPASDSTLLDLVRFLAGPAPNVDVDGDGRECTLDTNGDKLIDLCCDGTTEPCVSSDTACQGETIPSDDADPRGCARSLRLTDGYAAAFTFTAVPATIVGTGTR